jgi:hypothetical protein
MIYKHQKNINLKQKKYKKLNSLKNIFKIKKTNRILIFMGRY